MLGASPFAQSIELGPLAGGPARHSVTGRAPLAPGDDGLAVNEGRKPYCSGPLHDSSAFVGMTTRKNRFDGVLAGANSTG
jgi:hypothetical protein